MKTISSALTTHIAQNSTTIATCWKITREDGTVLAFTDHDKALSIDADGNGTVAYQPSNSFNRTALRSSEGLGVDTVEVESVLDSGDISEADLIAGKYDNAQVIIFAVNWADLTQGTIKLRKGWLGEVERKDFSFSAELSGLIQAYRRQIGSLHSNRCRSKFGDQSSGVQGGCGFIVEPSLWAANTDYAVDAVVAPTIENGFHFKATAVGSPSATGASEPSWPETVGATVQDGGVTWTARRASTATGMVASAASRKSLSVIDLVSTWPDDEGGVLSGGYFVGGKVRITSGDNNSIEREISSFALDVGVSPTAYDVTTFLPFPFDIDPGDTLILIMGCNKTWEVCKRRDNEKNFRGEPFLPGEDAAFRVIATSAPSIESGGKF